MVLILTPTKDGCHLYWGKGVRHFAVIRNLGLIDGSLMVVIGLLGCRHGPWVVQALEVALINIPVLAEVAREGSSLITGRPGRRVISFMFLYAAFITP